MSTSDVIFRVDDYKSRPIITVRENGLASFYRYADMQEDEKHLIIQYFQEIKKQGHLSESQKGKTAGDIEDYLNFKTDDDFCG